MFCGYTFQAEALCISILVSGADILQAPFTCIPFMYMYIHSLHLSLYILFASGVHEYQYFCNGSTFTYAFTNLLSLMC